MQLSVKRVQLSDVLADNCTLFIIGKKYALFKFVKYFFLYVQLLFHFLLYLIFINAKGTLNISKFTDIAIIFF